MLKVLMARLVSVLIVVAGSNVMVSAAFQEPGQSKAAAPLILYVSVTDNSGHPMMGLGPSDFSASIENARPSIGYFSNRDIPTAIGVLVDVSRSMKSKGPRYETILKGLVRFAELSNSGDQFFILAIEAKPRLVTDWIGPGAAFTAAVEEIGKSSFKESTALYDACAFAVEKVSQTKLSKKVLLLVSDGEDSASQITEPKLRALLEQSDLILFSIAITDPATDSLGGYGRRVLEELTVPLGGKVFFPGSGREALEALGLVATELRHQYAIGISRDWLTPDGRKHRIRVEVNPHEPLESSQKQPKRIHLNVATRKSIVYVPGVERN